MDGVHPSHAVRFVRGWIRKGKRVEIPTNSGQKRLNILGALNLEQMRLQHADFVTLNADSTICFLTKLMQSQPKGLLHIIALYFYNLTFVKVIKVCSAIVLSDIVLF
jgi:hypothetical protein